MTTNGYVDIIDHCRYSKFQTLRGALADAEQGNIIYLFKNVTELRLTYQIRLLSFRAIESSMQLVIQVPIKCKIHASLNNFVQSVGRKVQIRKV